LLSQGISKLLHALDLRHIHIFGFCNSSLQVVCSLKSNLYVAAVLMS
jgi:hypothetical protein